MLEFVLAVSHAFSLVLTKALPCRRGGNEAQGFCVPRVLKDSAGSVGSLSPGPELHRHVRGPCCPRLKVPAPQMEPSLFPASSVPLRCLHSQSEAPSAHPAQHVAASLGSDFIGFHSSWSVGELPLWLPVWGRLFLLNRVALFDLPVAPESLLAPERNAPATHITCDGMLDTSSLLNWGVDRCS